MFVCLYHTLYGFNIQFFPDAGLIRIRRGLLATFVKNGFEKLPYNLPNEPHLN
jgi:hypothetical protein